MIATFLKYVRLILMFGLLFQYLGRWYEYSKNPTKFEEGGTCNIANYEDKTANGKVVLGVLNQRIDNGFVLMILCRYLAIDLFILQNEKQTIILH